MIVYNTTFHAHNDAVEHFLEWLRRGVYSQSHRRRRLSEPRLTLVLNAEESDGRNYSLQFRASDVDTLRAWYEEVGDDLVEEMAKRFGHQVAGFSTLLEEVDL